MKPFASIGLTCALAALVQQTACGDDRTREFPAYKCRYTLPGDDWAWHDATDVKKSKDQVFKAHNRNGLVVVLACQTASGVDGLSKNFADVFENGYYMTSSATKRGGRFITFLGEPCYQAESEVRGRSTMVTRLFLAHGLAYYLTVAGGQEPVEKDAQFEAVMNGFAFEESTQASDQVTADAPKNLTLRMGPIVGACLLGGLAVVAFTLMVSKKRI